jgi:multimeric flavodoxin WrbA
MQLVDRAVAGALGALAAGADDGASGVAASEGAAVPTARLRVLDSFDAGADDVRWADGLLIATPARFGYMSGAMKDFFERVYYPCLEETVGRPYALLVKGDTDVDGAVASIERITAGLRWRLVLPALTVVGQLTGADLDLAEDLGATIAAGLDAGIF